MMYLTQLASKNSKWRSFKARFEKNITKPVSELINCERGVGAVEFALLVPVLLILYVGSLEISVAMSVNKKVAKASAVATDIISQSTSTDQSILQEMLGVAKSVIAPFNADNLDFEVIGIKIDNSGNATISWSWDEDNNTPFVANTPITIPTAYAIPNTFLLKTTINMDYKFIMALRDTVNDGFVNRTVDMQKVYYLHPREAEDITCSNC
jgi:Flp pilus assembly protein TadG